LGEGILFLGGFFGSFPLSLPVGFGLAARRTDSLETDDPAVFPDAGRFWYILPGFDPDLPE
jgi:hypothetical protein